MTNRPITFSAIKTTGFTLVELLLVLFILSSMALLTAALVDNADEQVRFEQTKTRLEIIRRAIIGDTSRTLNGQSEISGFVADMGRLPVNVQELIKKPDTALGWDMGEEMSGVAVDLDLNLYGGWRGPYIDVLSESGGERVFRDGWGNPDVSGVEQNHGWNFTHDVSGVTVQSYGADGKSDAEDEANPYHKDYPADGMKIEQNDWAVDLANQSVNIKLHGVPASTQDNLKLQIYYLRDGKQQRFSTEDFSITSVSGVVGPDMPPIFDDSPRLLPMGTHAAVIVCSDGRVYDGSCSGSNTHPPYYFKLIPRAYTPPLTVEWTVQ